MANTERKNIFEILDEKYDIKVEINKIDTLFSNALLYVTNGLTLQQQQGNIEAVVGELLFYNWKQRGACLSCQEMRNKLDIDLEKHDVANVLIRLEYYLNIINLANTKLQFPNFQKSQQFFMLERNIEILLDHLNYECLNIKKEDKILLVPKNPAATSVAEMSTKDTALAILMYNHSTLKGDLSQKQNLLLKIYLEYEKLLQKGIDGFSDYFDKTRGLVNKLNIKHNNKKEIENLDNKQLEEWYDELYQLLLFCVLIKDNVKRKNKAEEFLKSLK